jgi:autotransporter-associated beta strand protein
MAVLVVAAIAVQGRGQTWTGNGTDNNWSTAGNWSGGTPVSGVATSVTFGGSNRLSPVQNIASPFALNQLNFPFVAGAYTLSGNGLNFVSNGATAPTLTQSSLTLQTIAVPLSLSNNLTVSSLGPTAMTASVTGPNGRLIYSGSSTLTLSGSTDNVALGLTVNSGTVVLAKTSGPAVHAVGGAGITVAGGMLQLAGSGGDQIYDAANVFVTSGTLDANGASESFNALTVQGSGVGGNGAVVNNASGTTSTLPMSMTLAGATIVGAASGATLGLNGPIVGNFGLTKVGPGTVTLGSTSNTYSGGTVVNGGTLALGIGTAMPVGSNVAVNLGGTFSTGGQGNTVATAIGQVSVVGGTFRIPSGAADYYLNVLEMGPDKSGSLAIPATLDFTGSTNAGLHFVNSVSSNLATGYTSWIGAGTSHIQNDTASPITFSLPTGSVLTSSVRLLNGTQGQGFTFVNGGTFAPTNTDNAATFTMRGAILRLADVAAVGSGALTLDTFGVVSYWGPTATLAKSLMLGSGGGAVEVPFSDSNLTLSGTIGESGAGHGLHVVGSGTVTLTGNNTYTGPTVVTSGGVLSIGTITNGGVACPLGAATNAPENLVVGGQGQFAGVIYGGPGTIRYTGPTASTDRGLTLAFANSGGGLDVTTAETNLTLGGKITGVGSLIKLGPGTLTLTNTTNDYGGGTFINAGRLVLGDFDHILPPGGNVTIAAGAELDIGHPFSISSANTFGVALNGGAVRDASNALYLSKLITDANGGTFVGVSSSCYLAFYDTASVIAVNGNTSITGPADTQITAVLSPTLPIVVAPGATLTTNFLLRNFNLSGGGTMAVIGGGSIQSFDTVSNAKLRMDDLASFSAKLTIDTGTFQYGGPTDTLSRVLAVGLGGATFDVINPATTLTLSGAVTGGGLLTKAGPGVLVLNNTSNLYLGGITVAAGRLEVSSDAQLGLANLTVNPLGTLRYTASTATGRTFTLFSGGLEAAAGTNLTLNGATVGGGFLRGAGTFALTGGTAVIGCSTATGTTINVLGPATVTNFGNAGVFTVSAAPPDAVSLNNVTNQGSGSLIVGAAAAVGSTDFQSYGTILLNPAALTSDYSQTTRMTNTGGTPFYFNGGSRTFVGTAETAVFPANWPNVSQRGTPTFVAGIDLNGKNAVVAGGLFVNNGYVEDSSNGFTGTGTIVADFGSLVKGAGFFQNTVQTVNGGKFQAGNSPGVATFGKFVLGPGGVNNYVFAVDDATGAAGPHPDAAGQVSGWSLVNIIGPRLPDGGPDHLGDFTWTATPADKLTVSLQTLLNPTTVGVDVLGRMDHFDPTLSYKWQAVEWTGSYAGPADAAVLDAATTFDLSGFANPVAGRLGWSLDTTDHVLSLTYTPTAVPEPGTLALLATASGLAWVGRLRRASKD